MSRPLRNDRYQPSVSHDTGNDETEAHEPGRSSNQKAPRSQRESRASRRGSTSSMQSASSQGSGKSSERMKNVNDYSRSRTSRSRKSERELEKWATRAEPRRAASAATESAFPTTGHNNINSLRNNDQRERRRFPPSEEIENSEKPMLSHPPRPARQLSAASATSEINHEDEIERIREMRARRLRKERHENERSNSPVDFSSPARDRSQVSSSTRERQRERELQRQTKPANAAPSKFRSTPIISRHELESSGLVRRERRSKLEGDSGAPTRDPSEYLKSTGVRSRRNLSPDFDSSSFGSGRTDDSSAYSRLRRENTGKFATEEDGLSAYSRVRRERKGGGDDDRSSYSRSRRERQKDRMGSEEDDTASAYSQLSEKYNSRALSPLPGQASDEEHFKERKAPTRSNTGGDELAKAAAGTRSGERPIPPMRAKSADHDLLAMGLQRRDSMKESVVREPTRKPDKEQASGLARSTDLGTRLRERREARAAEKEAQADANEESVPSGHLESEVERRLARRRSNDDVLEGMSHALSAGPIAELQIDTIEQGETDSTYSVKLRIASVIDLPQNVVANMPLCPVVKAGFLKLSADTSNASQFVASKLGGESVEKVSSAHVKTTTTKIMSKRDNGILDFHQELRWDEIVDPAHITLFVEVSARAVPTPINYEHSKLPSFHGLQSAAVDLTSPRPTKRISTMAAAATPKHSTEKTIDGKSEPLRNLQRSYSGSDDDVGGGLRALWRKATNRKAVELEAAEAAATVARMLVEENGEANDKSDNIETGDLGTHRINSDASVLAVAPYADYSVALTTDKEKTDRVVLTNDLRLGTLAFPLAHLQLEHVVGGENMDAVASLEKWFQLDAVVGEDVSISRKKLPSIRLEISVSRSSTMDKIEDSMNYDSQLSRSSATLTSPERYLQTAPAKTKKEYVKEVAASDERNLMDDPVLEPGVIDFISVVGCGDIGSPKNDEGGTGWVESTPDCVVLEQFPPDNDYHARLGRKAKLPEMVQWFCFPEGARLWRGSAPPSHAELNLKRFSASSPPNVASSIAAFDACLNCTTSFSWFVIASNSDEYGSKLVKTYGAVIRFYAPAPTGVDQMQGMLGDSTNSSSGGITKRLWIPMGICLTSSLPIVDVMEAMLLRLCEEMVSQADPESGIPQDLSSLHRALALIILKYQKPIAGAVNCSVPFLYGDRFLLSSPPPTGLPSLPHGKAVVSACRLLGADGLNFILAAVLTECKILIHSQEIADIIMVAEVVTALIYPFAWSLPYIPILPVGMLEFVEAPLSYMLGVPSPSLKLMDPQALEDVVLVDLNSTFAPSGFSGDKRSLKVGPNKSLPQLPSDVASNISRAVYKLLRAEEEVDEQCSVPTIGEPLPRLEGESLAEREFRVSIAIEMTSLLRGYQGCLGPVFNRDRFLKVAPALFEDIDRKTGSVGSGSRHAASGKVVSMRSKRFLSLLVNTQNFHQLLESLEDEELSFFHDIMESYEDHKPSSRPGDSSSRVDRNLAHLVRTLQKSEDKIPTYRVDTGYEYEDFVNVEDDLLFDDDSSAFFGNDFSYQNDSTPDDLGMTVSFTKSLLLPVQQASNEASRSGVLLPNSAASPSGIQNTPWRYQRLFDLPEPGRGILDGFCQDDEPVKLRQAIGERRYFAWKLAQDQKEADGLDVSSALRTVTGAPKQTSSVDLTALVSSASRNDDEDVLGATNPATIRKTASTPDEQRVVDAKDRDIIRRCLDRAHEQNISGDLDSEMSKSLFLENGRDLLGEAENALRNPSAQRFLISILGQRSRLETQRIRGNRRRSTTQQASISRLDHVAFGCLIRMSCAILDSCMEYKEYETAYRLLTVTAGFIMFREDFGQLEPSESGNASNEAITMTSRLGLHPIFADLALWKKVMNVHLLERTAERKSHNLSDVESEDEGDDELEYESAVATLYEMMGYSIPGEELSRFAMRVSEDNQWFSDDRGRQLLLLARRITVRRDQTETSHAGGTGIEMMTRNQGETPVSAAATETTDGLTDWCEVYWCHPAAPTSQMADITAVAERSDEYVKRSPISALASLGKSVVVTGGLDGSVFLANVTGCNDGARANGVHLDWGSASRAMAGTASDGEYGVGAVSCLAAASSGAHHVGDAGKDAKFAGSVADITDHMGGTRIVAGTTAGDLRVWSVKDIFMSLLTARYDEDADCRRKLSTGNFTSNGLTRLKFSLRGRALSGHRGGVTCLEIPTELYRPDSLVTGGADGLIKLWSLRPSSSGGGQAATAALQDNKVNMEHRGRGGDALSVFSNHNGRICCIKTAWHGERLISGGADQTVRTWDLDTTGKCTNVLSGHAGWVTHLQHWGPNTIISGSSDRTMAIWDPRVSSAPLFMLRYHNAPISDILIGPRTDPVAVSAAADGTVATWDFRLLSQSSDESKKYGVDSQNLACQVVRTPRAATNHASSAVGSVLLCRGVRNPGRSVLTIGNDAIIREFDTGSDEFVSEISTGHSDAISAFQPCKPYFGVGNEETLHSVGSITASLDGTVRMRRLNDN